MTSWQTTSKGGIRLTVQATLYVVKQKCGLIILLLEESQIFVSESSFYRILHERGLLERMEHDFVLAADEFHHKTKFANEMWQTDFYVFQNQGLGLVLSLYGNWWLQQVYYPLGAMFEYDLRRCIQNNRQGGWKDWCYTPESSLPTLRQWTVLYCFLAQTLSLQGINIKHIHGKPLHPQT